VTHRKAALGPLLVLGLGFASCHGVPFLAPNGSTITLIANPTSVAPHGGVSIISALVVEPAGTLVADGTVVLFFTTLGTIDARGKTQDGVARVKFVSDSRSGQAEITACSGGQAASEGSSGGSGCVKLDPAIAVGAVARMILVANPQRILPPGRNTEIVATLFDEDGNPVLHVPVFFRVAELNGEPAYREWMVSSGQPVYTDNDGRAYDTLTTRRPEELGERVVQVIATTPTLKEPVAVHVQIY
jgi:hypothetical protein